MIKADYNLFIYIIKNNREFIILMVHDEMIAVAVATLYLNLADSFWLLL